MDYIWLTDIPFFFNYTIDIFLFVTAIIFLSGYNNSYCIIICQPYEVNIFSNQSCFTANKRSRHNS